MASLYHKGDAFVFKLKLLQVICSSFFIFGSIKQKQIGGFLPPICFIFVFYRLGNSCRKKVEDKS